ncbi:MAG: ArnT family glycosyltransferase, partial [Pirellulales bacterium]
MSSSQEHATPTTLPLWKEPELLVAGLLVIGVFLTRLSALGLQGEETRRAQVAAEILQTGDWIVPRQQGTIYLSRPPFGSWPIAALAAVRGQLDVVAIRLPTVAAIVLTTLLIYGYSRNYVGRLGAFAAAVAYPTMGQVLQIGRVAETEGLFTLLVAGSLLLWHWGYLKGWPAAMTWSIGYGAAALAGLTKGPQGPIYFVAATSIFLAVVRDRSFFLCRGHVIGVALFLLIVGSWQLAYFWQTDLAASRQIWMQNAVNRFTIDDRGAFLRHVASYPFEVLVCMLPWSVCLLQFANPKFVKGLADVRRQGTFLAVCLVVSFPTVWLATGARGRYYMPLYPVAAVLIGLTAERCFQAADRSIMRRGWRSYVIGMAVLFLVGALTVVAAGPIDHPMLAEIAQEARLTGLLLLVAVVSAVWLVVTRNTRQVRFAQASMLVCATLLGLAYTGPMINITRRNLQDVAGAVAEVRERLPADANLVSLGIVSHKFRHYYGRPI